MSTWEERMALRSAKVRDAQRRAEELEQEARDERFVAKFVAEHGEHHASPEQPGPDVDPGTCRECWKWVAWPRKPGLHGWTGPTCDLECGHAHHENEIALA